MFVFYIILLVNGIFRIFEIKKKGNIVFKLY